MKHISQSKCAKHRRFEALLEVEMWKQFTLLWRKARFQVKMRKAPELWSAWREAHLEVRMIKTPHTLGSLLDFEWQTQGIVHLVKSEQTVKVLEQVQKLWQVWDLIWKDRFRYKRHVHQRCWQVRALISCEGLHFGASDLQICWDDCVWQVQRFVRPGITSSWQGQYFTQLELKHGNEAVSSALNIPLLKEASQNFFVFHVVNFKNWGNLAELPRVWCCQVQRLSKFPRFALFWMLSSSKIEESWQTCIVFKLAERQILVGR